MKIVELSKLLMDAFTGTCDEVALDKAVKEVGVKDYSAPSKAAIKLALSECVGAGKPIATNEEAEQLFTWFIDLPMVKYAKLRIKKDAELSASSIQSEQWDVVKFIETPAYPFNRDVVDRSNKKPHLKGEIKAAGQLKVAVIRVDVQKAPKLWTELQFEPDEQGIKTCKIDGHSRTESWVTGRLDAPEFVKVDIYSDLTDGQILKLYISLNSPATAESSTERTQHVNKVAHFAPKSGYMTGLWKTAFEKCGMGLTHDPETINQLAPALMIIDGWNAPRAVKGGNAILFNKGVKRAIIASMVGGDTEDDDLRVYDAEPSPFWKEVLSQNVGCPEVKDLLKMLNKYARDENTQQTEALKIMGRYEKRVGYEVKEVA